MIKLLLIAALIALACRTVLGKWPWEYLSAKPTRPQAVLKARQLLGVRHEASRSEIVDAHRRLVAAVHPDRGGTNEAVHAANSARDVLLAELPDAN
jgi:hypothetical protein